MSPYTNWVSKVSDCDVLIAALGSGGVVTVDMGGYIRLWETGLDTLQRSLMEWRNMIGSEDGRPIQVIQQSVFEHITWLIDKFLYRIPQSGKYNDYKRLQPAVNLHTTEGQHLYFKATLHWKLLCMLASLWQKTLAETFLFLC